MSVYNTIESLKRIREELLSWADAATNIDYEDGLRAAADLITSEIDFEIEVERIVKMTPEEVKQHLFSMGYTQERLDASLQRLREAFVKKRVEFKNDLSS